MFLLLHTQQSFKQTKKKRWLSLRAATCRNPSRIVATFSDTGVSKVCGPQTLDCRLASRSDMFCFHKANLMPVNSTNGLTYCFPSQVCCVFHLEIGQIGEEERAWISILCCLKVSESVFKLGVGSMTTKKSSYHNSLTFLRYFIHHIGGRLWISDHHAHVVYRKVGSMRFDYTGCLCTSEH